MHIFDVTSLPLLYPRLVQLTREQGVLLSPRGKPNREIRPVVLRTKEWKTLRKAGVNHRFALAEAMAVVCGWADVKWLARFNPRIKAFSDDGIAFYGSYGARLRHHNQQKAILSTLKQDLQSRQGVLNIWGSRDAVIVAGKATKDPPCNTQMYLKVRNLQGVPSLDLTVFQRSSDLIWGLPYDHHVFHALLRVYAAELGVSPGYLTQYIDSLHVYEDSANFYDQGRVEKAIKAEEGDVPHWWAPVSLAQMENDMNVVRRVVEGERCTISGPDTGILTALSSFLMPAE